MKSSVLAALGGFAILAATGAAAQAQCANCSYQTYYKPVVVKHCRHVVPHTVMRPVVTQQVVPVVSYQTVQRTHYVPQTYYSTYYTTQRVHGGYGYGYGGQNYYSGQPVGYRSGLIGAGLSLIGE
jgi:hypothetical protein